jgi:putative chitinase
VTGLTAEQLARFAPHCDAEVLAPAIAAAAASFEINTPKRLAHWLGQLSAESMGLTRFVENLNYSAARLCQVWPHRFPDEASAELCVHNPQRLANTVRTWPWLWATPTPATGRSSPAWASLRSPGGPTRAS